MTEENELEKEQGKKTMGAEDLVRFRERIKAQNKDSLRIARLPPKTKEEFIAFAEKEFCGDYGMALKWLWDDMVNSQETNILLLRLQQVETRIVALENPTPQEKEPETEKELIDSGKAKRMADGSLRRMKK